MGQVYDAKYLGYDLWDGNPRLLSSIDKALMRPWTPEEIYKVAEGINPKCELELFPVTSDMTKWLCVLRFPSSKGAMMVFIPLLVKVRNHRGHSVIAGVVQQRTLYRLARRMHAFVPLAQLS